MTKQPPRRSASRFSFQTIAPLCSHKAVRLTNDELERQLLQLADTMENMSEMALRTIKELDQQIQPLLLRAKNLEGCVNTPFIQSMAKIGPSNIQAEDLDI